MTSQFLNTLFVQTQHAHVSMEDANVKVWDDTGTLLKVPLHHLGAVCTFGIVHVSMPLMMRCAEDGRAMVMFDANGRFKARVQGKTTGNVLLRKAQYDACLSAERSLDAAKQIVAAKLQNSRQVLLRGARDAKNEPDKELIQEMAVLHASNLRNLAGAANMDIVRGIEGICAQGYFDAFDAMITAQRTDFRFTYRSRRPPRDRMNALISFLYSMGTNDCASALEGVGLDPQFGMLHVLRPGRPALALDLVEEFRAIILDRLSLTLVNRKQINAEHFDVRPGESVMLNEEGRKAVLVAYQKRKQELVAHPLFKEKVPIGLLPHLQARILARWFRGDTAHYRPYMPP